MTLWKSKTGQLTETGGSGPQYNPGGSYYPGDWSALADDAAAQLGYGPLASNVRGAASNSLVARYQKMADEAKKANLAREREIRGTYSDILGRLGPGGAFEKSELADIQTQSEGLVGKETQNLISSGLYGTTTAASIPTRVEKEFARPARMKLEDLLETRRTEAKLGQAGFVERIQQPYPDYNALLQAMVAQGSR